MQFEKDGYLVIEKFYSDAEVKEMRAQAQKLLDEFDITSHPRTQFSTESQTKTVDKYFLDSSDNVSFFLEEKAVDADGNLTVPTARAVNKIGHALHKFDPVFKKMSEKEELKQLVMDLKFKDPILLQSMLIFKQPYVGGVVMPHQDSTFLYTEPKSAIGFWFPLEAATEENGCLWFIPGSHNYPLVRRLVRNPEYFEPDSNLKTPKQNCAPGTTAVSIRFETDATEEKYNDDLFVKAEVPAGAAVLIHGSVVHKSNANKSGKSRFAYAFHCIEGDESVEYSKENWLQMPAGVQFTHLLKVN